MTALTNHTIDIVSCNGYGRCGAVPVWISAAQEERRVVLFPPCNMNADTILNPFTCSFCKETMDEQWQSWDNTEFCAACVNKLIDQRDTLLEALENVKDELDCLPDAEWCSEEKLCRRCSAQQIAGDALAKAIEE